MSLCNQPTLVIQFPPHSAPFAPSGQTVHSTSVMNFKHTIAIPIDRFIEQGGGEIPVRRRTRFIHWIINQNSNSPPSSH